MSDTTKVFAELDEAEEIGAISMSCNGNIRSELLERDSQIVRLMEQVKQLQKLGQATADTLVTIDNWLGMAGSRQGAYDAIWRLTRMVKAAGFELNWQDSLEWRGSLVQELWNAGFYNGPDGLQHYDPAGKHVYGDAVGPTLKEFVGEQNRLRELLMKMCLEAATSAEPFSTPDSIELLYSCLRRK